jgi:hypothetical protein
MVRFHFSSSQRNWLEIESRPCGKFSLERSPLAKAAAGLLAVVGNTTRGFESLPSPPLSVLPSSCTPAIHIFRRN